MAELTMEKIESPVAFTDAAVEALKKVREDEQPGPGRYLRVGVEGGGCSGMSYVLEFDAPGEYDQTFLVGGEIEAILDKRHAIYLMDMTVDYQYGLNARGFVFQNPNASETCGCGTSFAV